MSRYGLEYTSTMVSNISQLWSRIYINYGLEYISTLELSVKCFFSNISQLNEGDRVMAILRMSAIGWLLFRGY